MIEICGLTGVVTIKMRKIAFLTFEKSNELFTLMKNYGYNFNILNTIIG